MDDTLIYDTAANSNLVLDGGAGFDTLEVRASSTFVSATVSQIEQLRFQDQLRVGLETKREAPASVDFYIGELTARRQRTA